MTVLTDEDKVVVPTAIELNFSSTAEGTEDKLNGESVIWKDILREGRFAITPGRGKPVPFTVVPEGESDATKGVISLADLHKGFEERAFEDVTIPDGHPKKDDSALNNTGYVRALRTVKKKGKHYLQAAMGFTEPEVLGKVKRGTVPNVSSGIFFNFVRKADAKPFRAVLNHVALTKTPWIPDLDPFKRVFASDDSLADQEFEVVAASFADDDGDDTSDNDDAVVVWNKEDSTQYVREQIRAALNPPVDPEMPQPLEGRAYYDVIDMSRSDTVLVEEYYKGSVKKFVIPYTFNDGKVALAPHLRWQEVEDALIAASDDGTSPLDQVLDAIRVEMSDNNTDADPDPKPAQKTSTRKVVPLFDESTPEGRVQAARQRRRQMVAGRN